MLRGADLTRRAFYAPELIAAERGHEDHVLRPGEREGRIEHLLGDPPAAAKLHRARVDLVHLRSLHDAVALLDEQTADALPAELCRQSKADRFAADNQDRNFLLRCAHDV